MSGYTKVDNWLFDAVMPQADPYTYKVVSVVVRKTAGWNRDSDMISISQFQEMIGAKSRTTTVKAIQDAIDNGWIGRKESGQGFIYWTISSTDNVPASTDNVLVSSTETVPVTSTENGHTKEHSKDNESDTDPVGILARHFRDTTGLFARADNWQGEWVEPLENLYDRAGTIDGAKELITGAVQFARDGPKRYTLTSPMSITTIAANLPLNGNANGTLKVGSR